MKISIHEITDQETEIDVDQAEPWLVAAVERVDESTDSPPSSPPRRSQPRAIHAVFRLRKVDEVVVLDGSVDTYVQLICSRCANEYRLTCNRGFSGLFCKDPVMAGVAHLVDGASRPAGQNKGFARHAHDESSDELIAEGKDLDITYLSADFIDLGDVLTEQLRLQIPFQPLCQPQCKGMCQRCGTDLNLGRCACAKLAKNTPFLVLKDIDKRT
jgi:uncharacterized protein